MMSLPRKNMKSRFVAWVEGKKELFQDEVELAGRHRFLHFIFLILKNFDDNRCLSRAGAMTFSTILAIVPTLAIVIGFSPLYEEDILRQTLMTGIEYFAPTLDVEVEPQPVEPQINDTDENTGVGSGNDADGAQTSIREGTNTPDAVLNNSGSDAEANVPAKSMKEQIVDGIMEFTSNLQIAKFGLFGFFAILGMVFSTLITIESVMNDIWDTSKGRAWPARLMSYWVVISVSGVMMVFAGAILAARNMIDKLPFGPYMASLGIIIFIALGLTVLYRLMPNANVKWFPALVGGVSAAMLIQLNKTFIPWIISGRAERDSQIYGSFVAVTLFMFGTYIAWVIVLFGAQVAATFQNRKSYLHRIRSKSIHQYGRETAAFEIMTIAAENFFEGKNPPTFDLLEKSTNIPVPLIHQTVEILIHHQLLRTVGEEKNRGIVPARPIDQISCFDIVNAMRCGKGQNLPAKKFASPEESDHVEHLIHRIEEFRNLDKSNTESISIKDLLNEINRPAPESKPTATPA